MDIRPSEISDILKKQITQFSADAELLKPDRWFQLATVSPPSMVLENVQAGEMVEFVNADSKQVLKGMALNLASDNVRRGDLRDDRSVKEATP